MQTAPTVLCWDPMACGTTFVQKYTLVQEVCSSHRCALALFCCCVQSRIALCCKEKLWREDLAQRSALFHTGFMHNSSINMCPDHISTGFLSPYYFLHPLTELLRLFKKMMKSFYDTLENQLLKSGSQSLSQWLCMHFGERTMENGQINSGTS